MVLIFPSFQEVVNETKENPKNLKELLEKHPELLNVLMSDSKGEVKYIRLAAEDQKRLEAAKKNGIPEGLIIGLAIALFFSVMGELKKWAKKNFLLMKDKDYQTVKQ